MTNQPPNPRARADAGTALQFAPGHYRPGTTQAAGETERLIREAIEFHLEGLREDGIAVPEPSTVTQYVEV